MILRSLLIAGCSALLPTVLTAQTPTITKTYPATPLPGGVLNAPASMMPLVIPLFLQGNHFASTLVMVSNATEQTEVDLTVRALDGGTVASKRVTLNPHGQQRVDIGHLLDASHSVVSAGSIVLMPTSSLAGPALGAMLAMTFTGSADPNYIDEEVSMPGMGGSQVLQGVVDSGEGTPALAISSIAETSQHVQIQCIGKEGPGPLRTVSLAAGETLLTNACSGPEIQNSEGAAVLQTWEEHPHGAQGIRLTSDAMPGSFAAFAVGPHHERSDWFFSSVLFSDPKTFNSSNTIFTGVPVGESSLLTPGLYVPRVTLTNFSAKDAQVHTTFARSSAGTPAAQELATVVVPANSTREITLRDLEGDSLLQNSFVVSSDGAAGAVMAKLVSHGDSQLHEVELQAKDAADVDNAGGHPWSIEGNVESTLLLFNHSNSSQTFTVRVSGGGVDWQKEYPLASLQTKAISIRDLVEQQTKDDNAKTLPKGATTGETSWLVTDMKKASGRLLQSDRATTWPAISAAATQDCSAALSCPSTHQFTMTAQPPCTPV